MCKLLKLDMSLSDGRTEISEEDAIAISEAMIGEKPVKWNSDMTIISEALLKQGFKNEVENG